MIFQQRRNLPENFSSLLEFSDFVSQERVSGFPEKGTDLRGSPGTSGEVWGTSGELPGNLWIAV